MVDFKARLAARQKERERIRERHKRRAELKQRFKEKPTSQAVRKLTVDDLDEYQAEARGIIHYWWTEQVRIGGVSIPLKVAGYSGTGKSTLLSLVIPELRTKTGANVKTVYLTFVGKAASVLRTKGLPAQTIHSFLYDCEDGGEGELSVTLKSIQELREQASLIVVDEASMVPEDIREDLESLGIPIIYTGDHGQIPPVSGRSNIMQDPDIRLEEPHRAAKESGITELGIMFRKGITPSVGTYGKHKDAELSRGKSILKDAEALAEADIVICHSNETRQYVNQCVRQLHGKSSQYPEVGDKILCVRNNKVCRLFNGMIFEVLSIETEEDRFLKATLKSETGEIYRNIVFAPNHFEGCEHPKVYGNTTVNLFEFGYCITGHKSQGSQWPYVIVLQEPLRGQTLSFRRRWKYTVATRAMRRLRYVMM